MIGGVLMACFRPSDPKETGAAHSRPCLHASTSSWWLASSDEAPPILDYTGEVHVRLRAFSDADGHVCARRAVRECVRPTLQSGRIRAAPQGSLVQRLHKRGVREVRMRAHVLGRVQKGLSQARQRRTMCPSLCEEREARRVRCTIEDTVVEPGGIGRVRVGREHTSALRPARG